MELHFAVQPNRAISPGRNCSFVLVLPLLVRQLGHDPAQMLPVSSSKSLELAHIFSSTFFNNQRQLPDTNIQNVHSIRLASS